MSEIERLTITLEARLDRYNREMTRAQALTNQKLGAIEARFAQSAVKIRGEAAAAGAGIGAAFGGIGAALGAASVIEFASQWTRLTRSLEGSEQAFGIALKPASELVVLANEARIDVEAFTKTYVRAAAAVRDYGYSSNDAAAVTSTLAKALKLGQASASEQASTILQFSQALQKGKLDGDEFRTVMENAGIVQEILAQKLKVSKGEIIEMAQAGKLNIKTLVGAMLEAQGKIDSLFRQMPLTVDEAFSVLRNNVVEYIGNADKMSGATQALASGIQGIANHLDVVAVIAGAALGSATLRMAAFAASAAAVSNPLTVLAAALGALAVGYGVMGDEIKVSDDGTVSLKNAVDGFFDVLGRKDEIDRFNIALTAMSEEERKAALHTKELADQHSGLNGMWRDGTTLVEGIANRVARMAGSFNLANMEIVRMIANATGLAYIAETQIAPFAESLKMAAINRALAEKASGLEFGFAGGGYKDALNNRAREPKNIPQKTKATTFSREIDQINKRIELLKAEAATIGQTTFVQEKARAAAELRAAAAATAAKEGRRVTAEEAAAIDKLSTAYANAQVQAQFLSKLQAERQNTADLQMQVDLLGLEGYALERARIQQELLNEAKKAGIELTPALQAEVDALAERNARMKETIDLANEVNASSKDALKGFIQDLEQGKSATEALSGALNKLADKMLDAGLNQLFGGQGGFGSIISSFLGGGSSAPTLSGWGATVTPFADGGVMIPGKGPARLPRFASGGVSRSTAMFGEAGPEAAVPLPDGRRIPVELRMPAMPQVSAPSAAPNVSLQVNIDARNSTPEAADRLRNDLVPTIQKVVRSEVNQMFDRSARFARSGI